MTTTLKAAVESYLHAKTVARGTGVKTLAGPNHPVDQPRGGDA
jgi:hypothetical protein